MDFTYLHKARIAAGNGQPAAQSKLRELRPRARATCFVPVIRKTQNNRKLSTIGKLTKRKNLNRIASTEVFCGATGLQTWYFLQLFSVSSSIPTAILILPVTKNSCRRCQNRHTYSYTTFCFLYKFTLTILRLYYQTYALLFYAKVASITARYNMHFFGCLPCMVTCMVVWLCINLYIIHTLTYVFIHQLGANLVQSWEQLHHHERFMSTYMQQ